MHTHIIIIYTYTELLDNIIYGTHTMLLLLCRTSRGSIQDEINKLKVGEFYNGSTISCSK